MNSSQRLMRFFSVGSIATLTDWSLLFLGTHFLGWSAAWVNPFSYLLGMGVNYLCSRYFTFFEARQQAVSGQALRYGLVQGAGLALDQFLVTASRHLAPLAGISPANAHWPGKLISLIGVGLLMFNLHRRWSFKARPASGPGRQRAIF